MLDDKLFINLRIFTEKAFHLKDFSTHTNKRLQKTLYSILSEVGGRELVGKAKTLSPGTFWISNKDERRVPNAIIRIASILIFFGIWQLSSIF